MNETFEFFQKTIIQCTLVDIPSCSMQVFKETTFYNRIDIRQIPVPVHTNLRHTFYSVMRNNRSVQIYVQIGK